MAESTLAELAAQGLFKFSFNDLACATTAELSGGPLSWEAQECPGATWEDWECDSLSATTFEQVDCGQRITALSWNFFTCENSVNYVKPVIYFSDTIYLQDDCS